MKISTNIKILLAVLALLWAAGFFSSTQKPQYELEEEVGHVDGQLVGEGRSGKWRGVRDKFVAQHPSCEACGSTENLNVHHVIPFSVDPGLELEPGNLITLCRACHFHIGHDPDGPDGPQKPDWKEANPKVREDSLKHRQATEGSDEPRPGNPR